MVVLQRTPTTLVLLLLLLALLFLFPVAVDGRVNRVGGDDGDTDGEFEVGRDIHQRIDFLRAYVRSRSRK